MMTTRARHSTPVGGASLLLIGILASAPGLALADNTGAEQPTQRVTPTPPESAEQPQRDHAARIDEAVDRALEAVEHADSIEVDDGSPGGRQKSIEVHIGSDGSRHHGSTVRDLPPQVIEKLTPQQLTTVLNRMHTPPETDNSAEIVVPIALFASLAFVLGFIIFYRLRKVTLRQGTLRAMVEKGVPIPQELLTEPVRKTSDLRRGLIWLGAGLGLIATLAVCDEDGVWSLGFIPTFIGVGYLIAWRLERQDGNDAGPSDAGPGPTDPIQQP